MKQIFAYFLTGLSFFTYYSCGEQQRVLLTVYYESMCPYARRFLLQQLYPVLEGDLAKYVDLSLVPYGLAETVWSSDNTNITFYCQHGPKECFSNLILSCSQVLTDSGANSKDLGFNRNNLKFINCFLNNVTSESRQTEIEQAIDDCAKFGVTAARLRDCADGTFGNRLLAENGKLTDEFQKPLTHMPAIVYNGVSNEDDFMGSNKDFKQVLCSKITWERPNACKDRRRH